MQGDFENRKPPKGESLIEVKTRGKRFLKLLFNDYKDKSVLIVSHGCFLKVLLGDLQNMSLYDSIFSLKIDHCSISEITIDGTDYKVNRVNVLE